MKRTVHVSKEFVNAALPPIPADFERDMREMILSMPAETAERIERKDRPMRRKLSVGFVLVVVLCTLAVGALAAVLLGGKDFVDQIMAPKAAQTDSTSFTKEEIEDILRIAKENGLTLSDQDMYMLTHLDETGYDKEELMRRFVKTEYGFYPAAWPIEVQHWYEQMLMAVGYDADWDKQIIRTTGYKMENRQTNVLPEGNEFTQDQILKIAQEYIHDKYYPDVDLNDESKYIRLLTYQEHKLGQDSTYREWSLRYEAKDLYLADYVMTLDTAGNIKKEYAVGGILDPSYETYGQFMRDRFQRVYGDQFGFVNWTSEIMLEYQNAMRHRQTLPGPEHFIGDEYPILDMTYVVPDDTMISREAAIEKAKAACGGLDYESLYGNSAVAVCLENPEGKAVWKVTLQLHSGGFVYAQLDAKTGEALFIDTAKADTYRLWRQYVTEEYWQENKPLDSALYSAPSEYAAGWRLTAFWGNTDIAPKWYWDRLNAVDYNEETEDALYASWVDQYGYDTNFWPLEAQAIEILTQLGDDPDFNTVNFPGLPSEGDLSQEEALKIAKAAFKEEYADELPSLDVSTLKGAFSFWFNYTFEGHNTWQVNLYRPDGVKIGSVWMESRLGEVYQMECFDPSTPGLRGRDASFAAPIATPAPLANGKPWMWGMDFAPQEFWDKLEQTMNEWGVTAENFEQKKEEWRNQYGDDIFLPYECSVMDSILAPYLADKFQEEKPWYCAFPQDGKITRDQAIEIGKKAVHEAGDEEVGDAWIDELKISAVLGVNGTVDGLYVREEPTWAVFFFAWDDTYGFWNQRASAYITEDGEVILAQLDLASNG